MAYKTLVTENFYKTPYIGTLPDHTGEIIEYDINKILKDAGVNDPTEVSEILIYAFFTGLGDKLSKSGNTIVRAVYEIYTKPAGALAVDHYSQLMNATFNQPDTVINSVNMWVPHTSDGKLYVRIPDEWMTKGPCNIPRSKKTYKNVDEAMKAFACGEETVFKDLFLLGYRLKPKQ
jgi:hypothetical protein